MNKRSVMMMMIAAGAALLAFGGWRLYQGKAEAARYDYQDLDLRIVEANNTFGLELLERLSAQGPNRNVAVSPYSVSLALALAYNGANGGTELAMRRTLQLGDMSADEINHAHAVLQDLLTRGESLLPLSVANSVWLNKGISFMPDYLHSVRANYEAKLTTLNLADPAAPRRINDWVKANTGGKIDKIVEGPLDSSQAGVLVNAIYYKGEWAKPFDKSATRPAPFRSVDGVSREASLMSQTGTFEYAETADYQAVRLPYKGDRADMLLLLPKNEGKPDELRRRLIAEPQIWRDGYPQRKGTVEVPRFKLEYGEKLDTALQSLGMGDAFDASKADFSRMVPLPQKAFIGSVIHKTYVEVDEKGTKAAAATSVQMTGSAAPPSNEPFRFTADRPFLFAIEDRLTGMLLFVGMVYEVN